MEYLDDTLAEMDGRMALAGTSDWLRMCNDDVSERGGLPMDERPPDRRAESRRELEPERRAESRRELEPVSGCGRAPPGLLTRLFRRSERYVAVEQEASTAVLSIVCLSAVSRLATHRTGHLTCSWVRGA